MKYLYSIGVVLLLLVSIQMVHATTYPDGCTATTKYSSTTGHLCSAPSTACALGDLFNSQTGQPCGSATYLPGCTSTIGYSTTTGSKCDGSVPVTSNATKAVPNNDQYVQQQLQLQQQAQEANNAQNVQQQTQQANNTASLQQSANTGIQNQIASLEQQVNQLRSTAQSQEQAYITGMVSARGQGLAQNVANKEASDEAPLMAQIQQLQSELQ